MVILGMEIPLPLRRSKVCVQMAGIYQLVAERVHLIRWSNLMVSQIIPMEVVNCKPAHSILSVAEM